MVEILPAGPRGTSLDALVVGTSLGKSGCNSGVSSFSAAQDRRIYVCLNIARPKAKDQLTIRWKREGKTVQRYKLTMPKSVARSRSRAYLALRSDRLGPWYVEVYDQDGTKLGSQGFVVTE
ncbi:MAG: DUF2914 domain-containing protein [Deltaproteobacteria bacterium]|nr:DUF2914 domain-containing protein [Deltaproteobacteria bacterium]